MRRAKDEHRHILSIMDRHLLTEHAIPFEVSPAAIHKAIAIAIAAIWVVLLCAAPVPSWFSSLALLPAFLAARTFTLRFDFTAESLRARTLAGTRIYAPHELTGATIRHRRNSATLVLHFGKNRIPVEGWPAAEVAEHLKPLWPAQAHLLTTIR